MTKYFSCLFAASLILLTGCASQQAKLSHIPLENINRWTAKGKLGLVLENDRSSASFFWQNDNDNFELKLHGPFGQGAVELKKTNNNVVLTSNEGSQHASSPEVLLLDNLGWTVPVSELHWWIKGLVSPNIEVNASSFGTSGELVSLQQQGWNIKFQNYQTVRGHMLPHKLIAKHKQVRLTLIIKSWSLKPDVKSG